MTFAVAILAIAVFLAGAVLGFLLLIIIGIRIGDCAGTSLTRHTRMRKPSRAES